MLILQSSSCVFCCFKVDFFIKLQRLGLVLHSWTRTRWDILQWAATACLCSSRFIAATYSGGCVCSVLLTPCDACYLSSSKVCAAQWLLPEDTHPAVMSSLLTPERSTMFTGLPEESVLCLCCSHLNRWMIGSAQISWHWRRWERSSTKVNWEHRFTVPVHLTQKKKLFIPFGLQKHIVRLRAKHGWTPQETFQIKKEIFM